MGKSTKEVWEADAAGTLLLYEPERLTLITDPAHPLYDERVHLPVDEGMVRSIMRRGVLQPICAVRDAATGQVLVAAGRQRTKAAIEANKRLVAEGKPARNIPVTPRNDTLSVAMEVSAAENAIRRDETPIQRAHKMRAMLNAGHDMAGVAGSFGCSESTVAGTLLLLDAHPAVQQALGNGSITAGAASKLLALKPEKQAEAVAKVVAAAEGTTGHQRARKQREAVAEQTGEEAKLVMRGRREIRKALESSADGSVTHKTLLWVLGESDYLPAA